MNALDQAFIKAFAAKDRPVTADEPVSASAGAKPQPPVSGVDSMELVLHELYAQGSRFRVDRPTCPESVFLAAHMIVPVVEHVESYEPADIPRSTLPQVVVEDRMPPLSEILQSEETPTAVVAGTSSKSRVRGTERSDKQPDALSRVLEERLELFVCPDLRMPDLETVALGSLAGHGEAVVRRCTTGIEIGWHAFDPELLTATPVADADESPIDRRSAALDAHPEESLPVDRRLSEAEEASLLQGVEPLGLESFTPAWEVDAFHWPEIAARLDVASGQKLTQSGDELHVATQDGLKVIAIVSTRREEGRSTLSLALARSAAAAGSRVALLDADGASPELARQLGLESPCDWQDVQRQGQALSEAAVASIEDRVTLFPLTVPTDTLSGRLDDPLLSEVLYELKRHFDLVVVDTPPLPAESAVVSAIPLPCAVDMAVLVRNVQATPQDECLSAVARLRAMGVRAVGIVENFAPAVDDCEVSHV